MDIYTQLFQDWLKMDSRDIENFIITSGYNGYSLPISLQALLALAED